MNDNQTIIGLFKELILTTYTTHTDTIFPCENTKSWGKLILIVLVLTLGVAPMGIGNVSTTVFLSDGNTPLALVDPNIPHVYQDIMVGTKLIIVVSSDTNEYWGNGLDDGGSLAIKEQYWPYGVLSARGPQIGEDDWSGSHLPAAGDQAVVYDLEEDNIDGFDLYTGSINIEAGNWFIIDYNAIGIGDCNVGFYDHRISWDEPVYYLCFSHVRTRDFNNDAIVNFADFAIFASHWLATNCTAPNWCDGTDLDINGRVDINDLRLFCQYWLERTK